MKRWVCPLCGAGKLAPARPAWEDARCFCLRCSERTGKLLARVCPAALDAAAQNRVTCPDCGDRGPHDDNGESGFQLMYCCRACGRHFDAEEAEVAADVYGEEG